MMEATCYVCGGPEDLTINPMTRKVVRDLRPYGPSDAWVCFDCAMATPERRAEADRQFSKRVAEIEASGDIVTITDEGLFGLFGKGERGRA